MPIGLRHGWGVAGLNICKELARVEDIEIVSRDYHMIMRDPAIQITDNTIIAQKINTTACMDLIGGIPQHGDIPCIQAIAGANMRPVDEEVSGPENIGYTFFEENIVAERSVKAARRYWDHVVCGSSWCADVLENAGYRNISVGVQGVDLDVFRPEPPEKNPFLRSLMRGWGQHQDMFIVFSGGKFELRKSQDVVIRAMKVIMERHKDVALVAAWNNMWPESLKTMTLSPLIKFNYDASVDPRTNIIRSVIENGIPHDRFQYVTSILHPAMAQVYSACNLGIFPNRCEGGTNLCMMEFMACGKPVIATNTTGHVDVLKVGNSFGFISTASRFEFKPNGVLRATWPEPDLDDFISEIEMAYQARGSGRLESAGENAREDMRQWTWAKLAQEFRPGSYSRAAEIPVIARLA